MRMIRTVMVGMIAGSLAFYVFAQEDDGQWLKQYVVVKRAETVDQGANGKIIGGKTVRESRINVLRVVTETRKAEKTGVARVVNRVTETTDTLGGKVTMIEELNAEDELEVESITSEVKTPLGAVTTVQSRDKSGDLVVTKRVTQARNDLGIIVTTVETLDEDGKLVVTQTTTQQQGVGTMK